METLNDIFLFLIHYKNAASITTAEMSSLLSSQCAVITGASRGIGLSIARLFTAEGASCLLVARTEPALKTAVHGLEALRPVTTPPPGQEGSDIPAGWEGRRGALGPGMVVARGRAAREGIVMGTDRNGQQRLDYVAGEVGEESTWREVLKKEVRYIYIYVYDLLILLYYSLN